MERLTEWFDDGILEGILVKEEYGEQVRKILFEKCDDGYLGMCVLKAYEDTGLSVSDIQILRKRLSRESTPEITRTSRDNDGWIPVEERLPGDNENVLVTTDMGLIASGYIVRGKWITDDDPDRPIAWRPFPEPFRPERIGNT